MASVLYSFSTYTGGSSARQDGQRLAGLSAERSVQRTMFRQVELNVLKENLLKLVDQHLNKREKQIVLLRFGLTNNPPLTQLETASLLGISRSYVSRIENKAIKKLRDFMEKDAR